MHKLSSHSFETEDGDKVKGHIVVTPPEDGDYTPGRDIGQVRFVVDNEDEGKTDEPEDRSQTGESDKPRSAPHPPARSKS
jgi:hypothetical protein